MAFIGLSIPSKKIVSLLGVPRLIGLTFKPAQINVGSPVMLEINQVIYDPNVTVNPVSFIAVAPIGGIVYRSSNSVPHLAGTGSGDAMQDDEFQFISTMPNNFSFLTTNALQTLGGISSNLIFSGAGYMPGLVAYPNSGITGLYGTLKVEVDRESLSITSGSPEDNAKIPAAIVGTPCPPSWSPFD